MRGNLAALVVWPAVPAVAYMGLSLVGWARGRSRDAHAVLRARMRNLPSDPAQRLSEVEHCFREACAIKLGLSGTGITLDAVVSLGEEWASLYRDIEAARYGGGDASAVEERVRKMMGSLQ